MIEKQGLPWEGTEGLSDHTKVVTKESPGNHPKFYWTPIQCAKPDDKQLSFGDGLDPSDEFGDDLGMCFFSPGWVYYILLFKLDQSCFWLV